VRRAGSAGRRARGQRAYGTRSGLNLLIQSGARHPRAFGVVARKRAHCGLPVTAGPTGKREGRVHAALRSRADERCRRSAAANKAVSSSTACASWAAVSGSSLTGPSLISPSSIVVGRSGSTLPPPLSALESANQFWTRRRGARKINDPPAQTDTPGGRSQRKTSLYIDMRFSTSISYSAPRRLTRLLQPRRPMSALLALRVGGVSARVSRVSVGLPARPASGCLAPARSYFAGRSALTMRRWHTTSRPGLGWTIISEGCRVSMAQRRGTSTRFSIRASVREALMSCTIGPRSI
jgi:hypothetical protein